MAENDYRNRENRVKADTAQRHQRDVEKGYRSPKNRRAANFAGSMGAAFDPIIEADAMLGRTDASARGAVGVQGNEGAQSGPVTRRNWGPSAQARRLAKALRDLRD